MNDFNLIPDFDKFKNLLREKKEDQQYSSGCLMGYFNKGFKDPKIKPEDLYDNDENEYGLEIEPHVTILYGLTDNEIDENDIINLFLLIDGPKVSADKISLFKNELFDVVKWDIESNDLILLNKMCTSMFPYKSDFPDYHAHTTIAYCLPGEGDKYIKDFDKSITNKIDYWVYSKADGKKIKITPGKTFEIIRDSYPTNESNQIADYKDHIVFDDNTEIISKDERKDESFNYEGYTVNITPNKKFNDAYNCSVYLDNEYIMGLRGPVSLENAKVAAIAFIKNEIK